MTDKFKQIADCYGPGDFNDLHAIDIEDYVLKAAKDVHLMWDEIQRLRNQIADYCGDWCDKRPMQTGCEWCPFYVEGEACD